MKNRKLDTIVGTRLALFMRCSNFTDAMFGKLVGAAAPTVATWRHGTRPYPHWRDTLSWATGWDWKNPESIAALTDEQIIAQVQGTVDTPTDALSFGSFAGLTLARDGVTAALASGRALDPSVPGDALVLQLCAEALNIEAARRLDEDMDFRSAHDLRTLVLGHQDQPALLAFLRAHVDARVLTLVEQSLPATVSA